MLFTEEARRRIKEEISAWVYKQDYVPAYKVEKLEGDIRRLQLELNALKIYLGARAVFVKEHIKIEKDK